MVQLFRAGIVAICCQLVAVVVITPVLIWASSSSGTISLAGTNLPFLRWSYILIALGLACTGGRSINATATRMFRTSYNMRHDGSKPLLMAIVAQSGLATFLLTVMVLWRPPHAILVIAEFFDDGSIALFIWPALMSIGVAGFGATAHASLKAIKLADC